MYSDVCTDKDFVHYIHSFGSILPGVRNHPSYVNREKFAVICSLEECRVKVYKMSLSSPVSLNACAFLKPSVGILLKYYNRPFGITVNSG